MNKYIQLASKLALHSEHHHSLGAVLVKGGKVISTGFNKAKTHKFARRFFKHGSRHAEIDCILGVDRKVTTGATVYVVRVRKNGNLAIAKPCPMCYDALRFVGIKCVVYTDNNGKIVKEKI